MSNIAILQNLLKREGYNNIGYMEYVNEKEWNRFYYIRITPRMVYIAPGVPSSENFDTAYGVFETHEWLINYFKEKEFKKMIEDL